MKQMVHKGALIVVLLTLAAFFIGSPSVFAKRIVSAKVEVVWNQNKVGGHYDVKVMIKADSAFRLGNYSVKLIYSSCALKFLNDNSLFHFCCGVNNYSQSNAILNLDTITINGTFSGSSGTGTFLDTSYLDTVNIHRYNFLVKSLNCGSGGPGLFVAVASAFFEDDNATKADNGTFGLIGKDWGGELMPIKLVKFSAESLGGNDIELSWITASEINSSYFEIERSFDGTNFSDIAKIQALGNSFNTHDYQYLDELSNSDVSNTSTIYYRLKEMDEDGTLFYSQYIAVGVPTSLNVPLVIYPIPSSNYLSVTSYSSSCKEIELKDMLGRDIYKQSVTDKLTNINISALPSGIYFAVLKDEVGRMVMGKFVKE